MTGDPPRPGLEPFFPPPAEALAEAPAAPRRRGPAAPGSRPATAPSGVRSPEGFCRRMTRTSDSNFYYSFLLLPRSRRQAIYAVYAYCRAVDDVVDSPGSDDPATDLLFWRRELDRCFSGYARHPITYQLARFKDRFELRKEHFLEILRGVEMDLEQSRYETFEDLHRYCYRVAGVVGLVCAQVFGHRDPATRDYAVSMGIGFQLVNILRDLKADVERGRIYLPLEDLWRFGCTEADLLGGNPGAGFDALMRFECERARETLRHARRQLPAVDRRSMWPAEAMGGIYQRLLETISARPRRVLEGRISIPRWRKAALALVARLGRVRTP